MEKNLPSVVNNETNGWKQRNTLSLKKLSLTVFVSAFVFLVGMMQSSFGQSQTFSTAGTFSFLVPANVTSIKVEAWGAGGGGGSFGTRNRAGGGGGAYASSSVSVTPGSSYTVTVGAGGAVGIGGGNSSFNGTVVVATGGSSNATSITGAIGGTVAGSTGTTKWAGGNGGSASGSNNQGGGGGGGSAFTTINGNSGGAGNSSSGGAGGTGTGKGGNGGADNGNGADGIAPGGGGGGRGNGGISSGSGAPGQVIISWSISAPTITSFNPTTACAGSGATVTITGDNFTGASSVKFNGTDAASFNVISSTSITAVLPSSATTGPITVTTSGGTATSTSFTVNPLPTATISGTTAVCENSPSPEITFTGANGTAPYTFTYNVNGGSTQTITTTSGNSTTVSAPTTTSGTFTYNLISVSGAKNCSQAQTGSAIITVNPAPTATISGTTAVCQNSTSPNITFTGANGTAPYTFTYTINGGANQTVTTTSGNSATVSQPTGTTGTFTYTLVNVSGAKNCTNPQSGTAIITVNPSPTATVSGTTSVCQNSASPDITFTGANGAAPYTFTYTVNGGANQTVTTTSGNSVTVSAPTGTTGTFAYTLVSVSGAKNCSNPQSGTATITVNPLPTATISGTTTLCQNSGTTNITFIGADGTAPYTFTYKINGGANQTVTTTSGNTVAVDAPTSTTGKFTYSLVSVSGAKNCTNPQSGTATITVTELPQGSLTGNGPLCSNGTAELTWTATAGTGPFTVVYNDGNANHTKTNVISGTSFDAADNPITATTTYTLVSVKDDNGCDRTSGFTGGAATITVSQAPVITTEPENQSVCGTKTVSFTVTADGVNLTYQWYKNGSPLSNTTNITGVTTNKLTYKQARSTDNGASYTVVITGSSACGSVTSDAAILNVDQTILISQEPQDQTVCTGSAVTLTVEASAGADELAYQWRKGGVNIDRATNSSYTINTASLDDAGDYDVVISGNATTFGCPDVSTTPATLTVSPAVGTPTTITIANNSSEPTCEISGTTTTTYKTTAANSTGFNWSISNAQAGSINSATGVMTWADGFSGTVDIRVTADGCDGPSAQTSRTVTVNAASTIKLTSGDATQSICANTAIGAIKYTIGGGGTGATVSGLPGGVTGSYNTTSNVFTISGTPTETGTFDYTVTTTGSCGNTSLTGTLTVNANSTLSLSSVTGTDDQAACINNAITDITYTVKGGGTGASITAGALPPGVTGTYNATSKVFTISGTPTGNGTFNYTVTTTGPCNNPSLSGTITVSRNSTIALTSDPGTDAQAACRNNAINNITYAIGGGGTGASITSGTLPAGVTGSYDVASKVFTVSGTPTASGTFNYTVTTSGSCNNTAKSGTITVAANSIISLSSANGTDAQTKCVNNAITNITYAIGGGGTGASITTGALPAGVTSSYNSTSKVFTISGTPTETGNFNYTVTTNGPCNNPSLSGTITVNANATISLSSAANTDAQTACINNAITNITYEIGGGGTGASITSGALPAGVTGSYNTASNVFTISGTPTASGTFTYTVTTSGSCNNPSKTGTITVRANSTITLSSAPGSNTQTVCTNNAITNITYLVGGSGTAATITSGALPAGVTGAYNTTSKVFTISGTPTQSGTFNYTVTAAGACSNPSLNGTITVNATATISLSSASSTDGQTICLNSGITAIKYTISGGTGATVTGLPSGVNSSYSSGTFTISGTPTASGVYNYTVTATGGCASPTATGSIRIYAPFTPNITASPTGAVCAGTPVTLTATGYNDVDSIAGGTFAGGNPTGWSGASANNSNGGSNSNWGEANGGKTFGQTVYTNSNTPSKGKFMIVNGLTDDPSTKTAVLTTPTFSTVGMTTATLSWYQAYNFNGSANGLAELSLDGGATYITLDTYTSSTQSTNGGNPGGGFVKVTFSLDNYLERTNLRIRWTYNGTSNSNWAIDDVIIGGPKLPITYGWGSAGSGQSITVTPTQTTTYTVTANTTSDCAPTTKNITITVNPLPTATITGTTAVCQNANQPTITFTGTGGTAPYTFTYNINGGTNQTVVSPSGTNPVSVTVNAPTTTAGTFTYNLVSVQGQFCTNTTSTATGSAAVTVNSLPTVAAISGTNSVCVGSTTALSDATTGGTWSSSNTAVATVSTSGIVTGVTAGTSTITYTVTNTNSCTNSATKAVTVNATPTVAAITGTTNVCVGSTTTLNDATTGGIWSSSNAGVATVSASGVVSGVAEGSSTITYTVTNASNCTSSTTALVTINPTPAPTITANGPTASCSGTVKLSSSSASGNQWYKNGAPIALLGTSQDYLVTAEGNYTVVVTNSSGCFGTSNAIAVTFIVNSWIAAVNNDWNTGANWCSGQVPTASTDAVIPSGMLLSKYPVLSADAQVRSLEIQTGANVSLNDQTLSINGSLSGAGKFIGSDASGLTINSTSSPVSLSFDQATNANVLGDLTVKNAVTVTLNDKLNITGTLTPNSSTINIADNLTIRSTSILKTGRIAPVSGSINGEVTVERFIPKRRAYRFISPAVTTSTSIRANWMEGGLNPGIYSRDNPKAGYGTNITGAGASFDPTITNNPSLFKFTNNTWVPVTSTNGSLTAGDAYSVLVRGDRSINMAQSDNSPTPTNTILRATGSLKTGTFTRNFTSASDGEYIFIGNPYASPVDFKKVFAGSTNISSTYYGWDPTLSRRGAYVNYNATTGLNSDNTSPLNNTIQSGQAFFVRSNGSSPSVTFDESYKTNGNTAVFRDPHPLTKLSIQLLLSKDQVPGSNADGVVSFFDTDFSAALGDEDSYKFTNPDENLAINHNGTSLSMEGRPPVTADDTIALKIWQFRQKSYYLKLTGSNFSPEVTAFVNDNYLHKQTSVDLAAVTYFSFTIDTTIASAAKDRFSIVFKAGKPLPVTLTHIKAYQKDQGIQVDWTSETETNVDDYEIERSANGQQFTKATVIAATGNNAVTQTYGWFDTDPNTGSNFYRIKVIDKSGVVKYSNAVKVDIAAVNSSITILPNPIKGSVIQVRFANLEKGRYSAVLYNTLGQKLYSNVIEHAALSGTYRISLGRLISKGTYTLNITKGDTTINKRIIVE